MMGTGISMSTRRVESIGMQIKWDESLSVGVASIDIQHQELFKYINDLLVSMKSGQGKSEVLNTLKFLEQYVEEHFNEEEALQKTVRYDRLREQMAQHNYFKNRLWEIRSKLTTEGINTTLVIEVQREMGTWWRQHIITMDVDLGSYIRAYGGID